MIDVNRQHQVRGIMGGKVSEVLLVKTGGEGIFSGSINQGANI